MSADTKPADGRPLDSTGAAYDQALTMLREPDAPKLDAVIWLSAHLSVAERVLHPAMAEAKGVSSAKLTALQRDGVTVSHDLRTLERRLTGDSTASGVDPRGLIDSLIESVERLSKEEGELRERLSDELSPLDQQRLADAYRDALERAPTRPHPYSPHSGKAGSVLHRINAWRDHLMDAMDVRRVPTPHHEQQPAKPSRWGDYLLGRGRAEGDAGGRADNGDHD